MREARRAEAAAGEARPLRALLPILAALAWAALAPSAGAAQDWKEFRTARQAGELESLAVEIVYGAGRLSVDGSDEGFLYDVRVQYDASRFVPVRTWEAEEGRGRIRVSVGARDSENGAHRIRREGGEIDLGNLRKLGDAAGRMEVALGRTVPTELEITVGAAESLLQLGGVPLRRLVLETGASDTRLSLDAPNPVPMREMELRAGAASFRAEGLGNARFERFRFRGGVGDVTLDFTGDWQADARGSISMGVGALRLRLPRELGVRIRKSSFLTAFDARGFVQTDAGWQTENWSRADAHLELDLDAAFGSITVERVP